MKNYEEYTPKQHEEAMNLILNSDVQTDREANLVLDYQKAWDKHNQEMKKFMACYHDLQNALEFSNNNLFEMAYNDEEKNGFKIKLASGLQFLLYKLIGTDRIGVMVNTATADNSERQRNEISVMDDIFAMHEVFV